ncbi:hypothetical protein BYT27DRAFT_7083347 [Phlegmacium glaucopus]|nr:hypothetical protein BYT27DRAFT_7083347 [Phlegmacium glaucopus]
MPLPYNTALSLLGYSRPGDAVQSKPKQAMIIRMSTETLDALESFPNHPQMEFELGANPRIYIGDTSFSMRHAQETTLHELYLRASKKTAPLKLFANVVGKFTVERELHDDVCDKLRENTQDAVNQRMTRTTQLIDTPPDIQPHSKKRKEPPPPSTMFRKPIRQSDKLISTSGASNPANAPVRTSAQGSREGSMSLRTRVVHHLAIADRTEDEVVRLVGGADCSPLYRREIHEHLEQLATTSSGGQPSSGNSSKLYHLKSVSWKEVRPYAWPKLSAAERLMMARSARHVFQDLGIPESDPAWDHIRNPAETNLRRPQPASAFDSVGLTSEGNTKLEAPKRGVSSQEVREKKAKQKLNPRAEVMMKDESLKVNSRLSVAGTRDVETTQMKRMQGTSHESSTTGRNQSGLSHKSAKHGSKRCDGDISQITSTKSQNARSLMQDDTSLVGKFPASDREGKNISVEVVRRRHDKGLEPSDSEREERRLQSDIDKVRGAAGREGGSRIDDKSLSKRKTTNRDNSEYPDTQSLPQKRRKTEPPVVHNPASPLLPRDEKPMGSLTLSKSNVEPRTRVIKDLPAPPSLTKRKDSPSLPSKHGHHPKAKISSNMAPSSCPLPANDEGPRVRHGSTKIRRRSPIYTSSEDEELPLSNRVSSHSSSLATPSTLSHSHLSSNSGSRTAPRNLSSRSVTSDHAALRARYSTAYLEYLTSLQKLLMQRRMIDQMLKTSDSGSMDSVTDSDGEVELLHPEELARLAADHKKRHEELVSIQQMFEKS